MPDDNVDRVRAQTLRDQAQERVQVARAQVEDLTPLTSDAFATEAQRAAARTQLAAAQEALQAAIQERADLNARLEGPPDDVHEYLRQEFTKRARDDVERQAGNAQLAAFDAGGAFQGGSQAFEAAESARTEAVDQGLGDVATTRWQGCGPVAPVAIGVVIAAIVGILYLIFGIGDDSSPSPSTEPAASGIDGRWVLVSGLKDTYRDMPVSCSHVCDAPGTTLTIDPPQAEIDISGTKITGGFYKVGYTSVLAGDPCPVAIQSKFDGSVSGGVDPNKNYGTLLIDGNASGSHGCDQNNQPIPIAQHPGIGHMSRLIYLKGDTLFLCYNLTVSLDACSDPAGGSAATFKRG